MATLEERVARLESEVQELRHVDVAAGLQAHAYGLSLVQSEVHDLRGEVGEFRSEVRARFAGVESTLAQILDRLEQR